jgi:hypothetical protein
MVEVELSPAGKKSTSVEVLVTTAVDCVNSAQMREKSDEHTSLRIADGGHASHEADGDDIRVHLVSVRLVKKYFVGGNTSESV